MTRLHRLAALALIALVAPLSAQAQSQNLSIGYTDYEVLLANMPEMQSVQQQIQTFFQTRQTELQQAAQQLQESAEQYQRQSSLLSEEAKAEREQTLVTSQQELQQRSGRAEQELAQRRAELMRPLFEKLQGAIDAVSAEKGLDLVLPTQVGGDPFILYVNDQTIVDITRDVAARLGIPVNETE
jgi:outer membrane protein